MKHHEGAENPIRALQIGSRCAALSKSAVRPLAILEAPNHIVFVLEIGPKSKQGDNRPAGVARGAIAFSERAI
jgi:hypothetical protein